MSDTATLNAELNDLIRQGKALEGFERFYHDDVVMMENDEAFTGKEVNRKRQEQFFGNIKELHKSELGATAVGGDTCFCVQTFDVTFKDDRRMAMDQVSVRTWKDGKIIKERFFYKGM